MPSPVMQNASVAAAASIPQSVQAASAAQRVSVEQRATHQAVQAVRETADRATISPEARSKLETTVPGRARVDGSIKEQHSKPSKKQAKHHTSRPPHDGDVDVVA